VDRRRLAGLALGAGSGVLYASIYLLAKPLDLHPFAKGAIAYLVSALALSPWLRGLRVAKGDTWKVLVMGLVGGGVAPAFLFFGMREAAASDAGVLLTVEMVATAVLAYLYLHERFRRVEVAGLGLLLAAAMSIALASRGDQAGSTLRGVLLVLGAAIAWGADNAVSARLVGSYRPAQLIAVKGLLGGSAALAAAIAVGAPVPPLRDAALMAGLGISSIALSSLMFYVALRRVGAARTSAMNIATTALTGAVGGALLLDERLTPIHGVALALALAGAGLLAAVHHAAAPAAPAGPAPPGDAVKGP
jgi:drug/metabolite transporter (DMT)-like permease